MSQTQRLGSHCTNWECKDGITRVTYHNTDVVTFTDGLIILNTGGWFTVTTKARMNQTSKQFDLGYRVFQHEWLWFVDYKGTILPFSRSKCEITR